MTSILMDILIRSAVLLALAWVVAALLRRRSASVRAFVWTAAFAGLLSVPMLAIVGPSWPIAVFDPPAATARAEVSSTTVIGLPEEPVRESTASTHIPAAAFPGLLTETLHAETSATPTATSWSSWALLVSVVMSVILAVRLLLGYRRVAAMVRCSQPLEPESSWRSLVDGVRAELGIRRTVSTRLAADVSVPAVFGIVRPTLLLPLDADSWPTDVRRVVVLHELAHVARWDAVGQLVTSVACAVYWFVPFVWIGAKRAALLRERASDDVVLRAGIQPGRYAANLVTLVREAGGPGLTETALAMGQPSRVQERLVAILDPVERREAVGRRRGLLLGTLAVSVIVATAAVDLVARTPAQVAPVAPPAARPAITPIRADAPAPLTQPERFSRPATTPAATPPAGQSAQPKAGTICDGDLRNSSTSRQENDGRRRLTVKLEGAGCSVDLQTEGKIDFNADFSDVAAISPGGFFRLDVTARGVRRQIALEPRNGSLTRIWRVDGKEQPYDAAARAWFATFLVELDRRTAIGADVRLPHLLKQGGPTAVLNETALMPSDYVRNRYYVALNQATTLSAADLTRMLTQASAMTKSDYYSAELIGKVAAARLDDASVRRVVAGMVDKMTSDHYRVESIKRLTAAGRPTTAELDMLLNSVPRMTSDFYKQEALSHLVRQTQLTGEQQALVAKTAATIDSDHYAAEFLKTLIRSGPLTPSAARGFTEALAAIKGGHYFVDVITAWLRAQPYTAGEAKAVIAAAGAITSDHYRTEGLSRIVDLWPVTAPDLMLAVDASKSIPSDHYKSAILSRIARHKSSNDAVQSAVLEASQGLSNHYADQVRRAIRR
ncbi:MAG: M56 family metallopeptidase [Vicinamibacterales bacterium]